MFLTGAHDVTIMMAVIAHAVALMSFSCIGFMVYRMFYVFLLLLSVLFFWGVIVFGFLVQPQLLRKLRLALGQLF